MPATPPPEFPTDRELARVVSSDELFGDQTEVVILHRGAPYRLRITRQDKLILTK